MGLRMINARAESVLGKGAFAKAALSRRCIVPAEGWYEWQSPRPPSTPRASRASSRSSSTAPTAPCRLRRSLRVLARPRAARRRPRRVAHDLHDHHDGGRPRHGPHPRPPAARARARAVGALARPRREGPCGRAWAPRLRPARPVRGAPDRPRRRRDPNNGPDLLEPAPVGARRGRRPHDRRGDRGMSAVVAWTRWSARSRPRRAPTGPRMPPSSLPRHRRARARGRGRAARLDLTVAREVLLDPGWPSSSSSSRGSSPVAGSPAARRPRCGVGAVVSALMSGRGRLPSPLVVGGRSAGARVACRTAAELGAHAGLLLSFPLHPPGQNRPTSCVTRSWRSRPIPLDGAGDQRSVRHPGGAGALFPEWAELLEVEGAHCFPKGARPALVAALTRIAGMLPG